jgi:hypothetical protein
MKAKFRIGLVEVPSLGLIDANGNNWTHIYRDGALVSKQVMMAQLENEGYEVHLYNLKLGDSQQEIGSIRWKDTVLTKVYVGSPINEIDAADCDAWGVTANFMQQREVALLTVRHLASRGKPVIVGGSDALNVPNLYFQAGARAVVTDKSGAATVPVFDHVLGRARSVAPAGFILSGSGSLPQPVTAMSPQDWPLPSVEIARQCMGTRYAGSRFLENILGSGSVFPDIGCDRTCDF